MNKKNTKLLISFAYISLIVFFLIDLFLDYSHFESGLGWHFYLEMFFVLVMIVLLAYQLREIYLIKRELKDTKSRLSYLQSEISKHIEEQFEKWHLTKSEKSVARLILKGFSFKEIADIRKISEKTIHQQSTSIYQKSGAGNRHELMSGFLEEFTSLDQL